MTPAEKYLVSELRKYGEIALYFTTGYFAIVLPVFLFILFTTTEGTPNVLDSSQLGVSRHAPGHSHFPSVIAFLRAEDTEFREGDEPCDDDDRVGGDDPQDSPGEDG